jgi:hypothetical protein
MVEAAQGTCAEGDARGGPSRPSSHVGIGQLAAMQAVAPSLSMEVTPIDERDPSEIERGLNELARAATGGLIVTASVFQGLYRKLIITLVAWHRLRNPTRSIGLIAICTHRNEARHA